MAQTEKQSGVAPLLIIVEIVLAAVGTAVILLRQMGTPYCGQQCGFELLRWTWIGYLTIIVGVVAVSVIATIVLARRGRVAVWAPIGGSIVVVVTTVIAYLLSSRAIFG